MRYFTVAEANALLPEIEPHLRRLQDLWQRARELAEEMERLRFVGKRPDGALIMERDYRLAEAALARLVEEAEFLVDAVHRLGAEVKDAEAGLVDFPALLGGRAVYLCWRLGEPEVAHYHGMDEGFRGRRRLPM